jgi:glycosyltransferase involved in cell wall biosynthesis
MRIAVVADTFAPLRTSGAVQLSDLVEAMARAGHEVTVLVPDHTMRSGGRLEEHRGATVARLACPRTKDVNSARRLAAEILMPYAMWRSWRKVDCGKRSFDGIVFYSPSIFLPPLVERLARIGHARRYLIIRDIFPEWALDIGKLKPGPVFWLLKKFARRQFATADVIGVQTPGNLAYFKQPARPGQRLEVLYNWLSERPDRGCSIDLAASPLAGRKLLVYAGNIGIAQDLGIVLDIARELRRRSDIGFVFVGRGTDVEGLRKRARDQSLGNVLFFDEIDPDEIPGLYRQCAVGLVILDTRHRTHNIPGKFLSYIASGLPVLAVVNEDNDLLALIRDNSVGIGVGHRNLDELVSKVEELIDSQTDQEQQVERCRSLSRALFSADAAAEQVVAGLQS